MFLSPNPPSSDCSFRAQARVCSLDHSLSSDYMQLTILGEAKVYIPEDGFIWGPCLCLAVLAAWGFHNCILVREVFEFLAAVSALHVRDSVLFLGVNAPSALTLVGFGLQYRSDTDKRHVHSLRVFEVISNVTPVLGSGCGQVASVQF